MFKDVECGLLTHITAFQLNSYLDLKEAGYEAEKQMKLM